MGLIFFKNKNNKPDNRMVEYDQAVVRLGLEKAGLEREMDKKRREARGISVAVDLARSALLKDIRELTEEKIKEIEKQSGVLVDYEKRVVDEKKKLEDLVLEQNKVLNSVKEKEKELSVIGRSVADTEEVRAGIEKSIGLLLEDKKQKEKERNAASSLLQGVLKEKNKAVSDVYELDVKKSESELALEKANKDLSELNEIISILQTTNRQGLDLVASFDGERKRLQEKDEFLARKEKDLLLYEKRIEKRAKELGVDIKLTFK